MKKEVIGALSFLTGGIIGAAGAGKLAGAK